MADALAFYEFVSTDWYLVALTGVSAAGALIGLAISLLADAAGGDFDGKEE